MTSQTIRTALAAALALAVSALTPPAAAQNLSQALTAKSSDGAALSEAVRTSGEAPVIVMLAPPGDTRSGVSESATARARYSADLRALQDTVVTSHFRFAPATEGQRSQQKGFKRFPLTAGFAIRATDAELRALASDPRVLRIQLDVPVPPQLDQSVPLIGADTLVTGGDDGTGYAVAIIDTGVDKTHEFFGSRVVAEACFSTTNPGLSTSLCPGGTNSTASGAGVNCSAGTYGCDHGTHVAGIAAGFRAGTNPAKGVAPGAKIIAIQVFSEFTGPTYCGSAPSPCALTWTSDQILALNHVASLESTHAIAGADIAAVNMSLGGSPLTAAPCDSDPRKPAIDALRALNVATVVSAGNDGSKVVVSSPACITTAITVGSTTKTDEISPFSNIGWEVDVLAPGSSIMSSVPGGAYAAKNGTSMAAPHVTGSFAILRQIKPTATVEELETALESSGLVLADDREGTGGYAKPRIRLVEAAQQLIPPPPTLMIITGAPFNASGSVGQQTFAPASANVTVKTPSATINWHICNTIPSWLNVSPTSGVATATPTNISISVKQAAAAAMPVGTYTGELCFINDTTSDGDTNLAVSLTVTPAAPINDNFVSALSINSLAGVGDKRVDGPAFATTLTGTTANATRQSGEPAHAFETGNKSIWYKLVTTAKVPLGITVDTVGSSFDTVLGLYTGAAVNALTTITSNDDTAGIGSKSRVSAVLQPNVTYYIAVDGYNAGAFGDVVLNVKTNTAIPELLVVQKDGFVVTGKQTGPFAPAAKVFHVKNAGTANMVWLLSGLPAWADANPKTGTLVPGAQAAVTVTLKPASKTLLPGSYLGNLAFTNTVNNLGNTTRPLDLRVTAPPSGLVASLGTYARATQTGVGRAALLRVTNASTKAGTNCAPAAPTGFPGTFAYRTATATGVLTGLPNKPVALARNQTQYFNVTFVPSQQMSSEIALVVKCANLAPVVPVPGVNTFILSSRTYLPPDIVSSSVLAAGKTFLEIPGSTGTTAFTVNTANLGAPGRVQLTVSGVSPFGPPRAGGLLPAVGTICRKGAGGTCVAPLAAAVTADVKTGEAVGFAVSVRGTGAIAQNASLNRVFVVARRLADGLVVGATSVAVKTVPAHDQFARLLEDE